jgi:archaellum component FlaC
LAFILDPEDREEDRMSSNDDILRALGRVEGKIDSITIALKDHTDRMNRIDEDIENVEKRVGNLERKQYAILTIASIIGAIISLAVRKFF